MRTKLNRLEDFIKHLRDEHLIQAYYTVETRQAAIPQKENEPAQVQLTSAMILTAKTPDDKKHFSLIQNLNSGRVGNDLDYEAYTKHTSAALSEQIQIFQDRYAACHLTEGVVE